MRRSLSIRTYVMMLAIGTVLPSLAFSALLLTRTATAAQDEIARTVRDAARTSAADLNRHIADLEQLAIALTNSRLLQTGDLAGFQRQASQAVARQGLTVVLYDPSGLPVVDTATPSSNALPFDAAAIRPAIETGQPQISELTADPHSGQPGIAITVPVWQDNTIIYVLGLQISRAIAAVLADQVAIPGEVVSLVDRHGTIIGRTRGTDRFIGSAASPELIRQIRAADEGSLDAHLRDGPPAYLAFNRVKLTDWVAVVAIPQAILYAPVRRSLLRLLALDAAVLLAVGLIVWTIGRVIDHSVTGLSRFALALGSGTPDVRPPATRIREVATVASAMLAATEALRQQTEQRAHAMTALQGEAENRRHVEQQLVQSQKMEAVGQLTGGLAHDFNNLLAIIVGNLDLLRERWPDDPLSVELAGDALDAALHGAELTSRLLAFARRQPLVPERCDINQAIEAFARLLRRTLGKDISIDLRLTPDVWPVLIDRVQLEAAIVNLATNARDAMPQGGRLTIATRNARLGADDAASHPDVAPGDYVLIEVQDTGTGMPPAVLERIFEPFYTTKPPDRGTGLGLSMVFGFIKQSGGHVTAASTVGKGSTFRLYLPPAAGALPAGDDVVQGKLPVPTRNETILAVEDNPGLRRTLARQLTAAGYDVIEADSARTALTVIEGGAAIDLLLTDIVMPGGMNGRELAAAALERRPGLRTLLTSGFPDLPNGGAAAPSDQRMLHKPYRAEELLRAVREVLDG
ncbi:MAG: ATP-binding protein [Acetobacteraceae bacterium]|nr:ATP-binding protein [Acetobacteraceae bacterium]